MPGRSSSGLRARLLRYLAEKKRRESNAFHAYIERLRARFPGYTVVLFGSRARGDEEPVSDYDVALIVPREVCDKRLRVAEEARRLRGPGESFSLDLLVLCADELGDEITRKMLEHCIVLHDGLGVADRLPCSRRER